MPTLIAQPSLAGTLPVAFPQYSNLANGYTDRIFLLGHGPNSMPVNDPYQVVDIQEAVTMLGADSACPLMRGLMELYYGGARDIFLVSAAPMSEYQADMVFRDFNWYQNYSNRLQATYDMLLDWDLAQVVVPLNAPYFDAAGVDFLTPLANHCARAFDQLDSVHNGANTGSIRIGLLGTNFISNDNNVSLSKNLYPSTTVFLSNNLFPIAIPTATDVFISSDIVNSMAKDTRLNNLGEDGKFIAVVIGEGVINIPELSSPYVSSLATSAAAEMSQLPYNRSLSYIKIRNNFSLRTRFRKSDIDILSEAKLNVVDLTALGWRNQPFESVILTDNTLGKTGTDFWSLTQMRISMHIIDMVRALGRRHLGSIGFGQFKQDVQSYLLGSMKSNFVKEVNCNINRDTIDPTAASVDITFTPYFGVREINFVINVGPQN